MNIRKPQYNIAVPPELQERVDQIAQGYGVKQKWAVVSAGLLMLLEVPEAVRNQYIEAIGGADMSGRMEDLIKRVESGQFRSQMLPAGAAVPAKLAAQAKAEGVEALALLEEMLATRRRATGPFQRQAALGVQERRGRGGKAERG